MSKSKVTFSWVKNSQAGVRSEVWKYFLRGSDKSSAKCGFCSTIISTAERSTGTLLRHLKRHDINALNSGSANLEDMTYNDASWVKKSDDDGPAALCLLCGDSLATADQLKEKYVISKDGTFVKVEAEKGSSSPESAEHKLEIFKAVCKQLEVGILAFQQWDFREEDLPFCTGCKKTAENLHKHQVQMDKIKKSMLEIEDGMKKAMEESEKTAFVDDLEHQLLVQARMRTFRSYLLNGGEANPSSEIEDLETEENEKPKARRSLRKRRRKSVESADDDDDDDSSSSESDKPSRTRKRKQANDSDPEVVLSSDEEEAGQRRKKRSRTSSKTSSKNGSSDAKTWQEMEKEIVDIGGGNFSYREIEFVFLDKLYVCRGCPGARSFITKIEMLSHIRVDHLDIDENFCCPMCPKIFRTINALKTHTFLIHQTHSAVCTECGKKFSKVHNLRRHLFETHGLKLTIACTKCPSLFKTKDDLKLHQVQVHNEKSLFCDCCGQGFDAEPELEEHKKTHEALKFFRCFYCSANFLQKVNIGVHFATKHGIHF